METEQTWSPNNGEGSPWRHWVRIWKKPRETMRKILDEPNNYPQILLLLLLGGYIYSMNQASIRNMGDTYDMGTMFSMFAVSAVISVVISYYIIAGSLYLIGKLLGGKGSLRDVRLGVVYAQIPSVFTLITWIPSLLLFGKENFTTLTPMMDSNLNLLTVLFALGVVEIIIGVWAIVIALKCLAEAHQFSAWRALATYVLLFLAVVVIVIGIVIVVVGGVYGGVI